MSGQREPEKVFSADRFREEIDRRFLSISEAARLIGKPERTIERWLAGTQPRRPAVRQIGEAFEVDPASFYVTPEREAA